MKDMQGEFRLFTFRNSNFGPAQPSMPPAAQPPAAAAGARRPPKPQVDQSVVDAFVQHDATILYRAWAALEKTTRLTRGVVLTLGLGMPSMIVLHECTDADDKAKNRKKVAQAMIALDHKLGTLSEETDAAAKAVYRRDDPHRVSQHRQFDRLVDGRRH